MKTTITPIISLILAIVFCILCFAGCGDKPPEPETTAMPETTPAPETPSTPFVELSAEDSEQVKEIIDVWHDSNVEYEILGEDIGTTLGLVIYDEYRLLLTTIESQNCYFVAAYSEHDVYCEYTSFDDPDHDCGYKKYKWVRFEKAEHIVDSFKNEGLIAVFQFNPATSVEDILSADASVPGFEHFSKYAPEFENGVNTKSYNEVIESFIYVKSPYGLQNGVIYSYRSSAGWEVWVKPCTYSEGAYYLTVRTKVVYSDPERAPNDKWLEYEFGELFYNDFVGLVQPDVYSETDAYGNTDYYGIISVDDFAKTVRELIEAKNK